MRQAVVLAAGRSTRTMPLTATRPKPLLPVAGRALLDQQLRQLVGLVDEVVLVVGYRREMIRERFGDGWDGLALRYVEQAEPKGTADAVRRAAPYLRDRCLVLNGDDFFDRRDLEALLRHDAALLVTTVPDPHNRGVVRVEGGRIVDIVEKPPSPPPDALCSVGAYVFPARALDLLDAVAPSPRGELELPDFVRALARRAPLRPCPVRGLWLPLTYAWDVLVGTERLLEEGVVAPTRPPTGLRVEGPVVFGPGVILGEGVFLRGPAALGAGVRLGGGAVVDRSVLFDGARVGPRARLAHSVLGEGACLGEGAVVEAAPTRVTVKGRVVPTERPLGLVAGDGARIDAGARVPPGTLLAPGARWPPSRGA